MPRLPAAIASLFLLPLSASAAQHSAVSLGRSVQPVQTVRFASPASLPSLPAAIVSPSIALPLAQIVPAGGQVLSSEGAGALLQNLGAAATPANDFGVQAMGRTYDNAAAAGGDGVVPPSNGDGSNGGSNGGGPNGRGPSGPRSNDGGLGRLYPRVVMILDTLDGPASDKLVSRIETLLDKHVHVVFVTARADKGPNSAEDVLVSKLKVRSANPIVVVSYNGARIAAHNSRAEKPKGLVEDMPGFAEPTVAAFRKINAALRAKLGGTVTEQASPSVESAHLYGVRLPAGADAKAAAAFYNRLLQGAGYKYRMEVREDEDGRAVLMTQSTALKLNTERVFQALQSQFPHLQPASPQALQPSEILVLADSTKAAGFLKSLPGSGHYIHGVKDAGSLENALDAVLGNSSLEKVTVIRSQLRAYTEWLEARARFGAPRKAGGSFTPGAKGRQYRELGFYRGIIMYDIMGRLYHLMRKGQYMEASPEAAEELLRQMWYHPLANGVRISEEMESTLRALRRRPYGRAVMNGYYDTARQWLRQYYNRNFKDYPIGVSQKVVGTMINLARDTKNTVVLEYASPFTGRRYVVHLVPARAHLERDDKGNLLVAHVYRTGKEPYQDEFEDSVETNLLARAMLQGYADKRDGVWYVNDEPNPRVKVMFHYMTRDLSRTQTVEEIEAYSSEVTALIEKMNADKEFLAHWEEQEAKNNKAVSGAAKARAEREAKAAKKAALKAATRK